jgi:aminomethyltransferase
LGCLALQGPHSFALLRQLPLNFEVADLDYLRFKEGEYIEPSGESWPFFVARTGYTGAVGCELIVSTDKLPLLWQELLEKGSSQGLLPAGLGARDLLRLEMGFALYGHELSEEISPLESVSRWSVCLTKNFVGSEAMKALAASEKRRFACGLLVEEGIPRQGCPLFKAGKLVGTVTSGGFSPGLKKGIALALCGQQWEKGETLEIAIRDKRGKAFVFPLPFVRNATRDPLLQ